MGIIPGWCPLVPKDGRRLAMTVVNRVLSVCAAAFAFVGSTALASEESLEVRFTWKIKGEYAGLYVAEAKGLFAQNGLKVSMKQGAGGQAAMAGLLQGQEDVVVSPGAYALSSVSKGMPIKIIALYHPATPLALFSHADKPIRVPKDLVGKKIATSFDTFTNYINVFCKKTAIDCSLVNKVRVNNNMQQPLFIDRQVDAFGGYLDVDWPLLKASTPKPLVYIDLTKYGMVIPGLSVVASDAVIAKRPEALRKFLAAVGRGTEMARADVSEATNILLKVWDVAPSRKVVQEQIQSAVDFIPIIPNRPVGWIEQSTLVDALNILQETGQIDHAQPLGKYYTNALLMK
jgi:NitT/TauT family transport system substrate-binding protein